MKWLCCILLFLVFPPSPVLADSRFATKYDLTYKVEEAGITTVTQNFTLINKTSEFLPQEYLAKIGKKEIANIQAYDQSGPLEVKLIGEADSRAINIKFRRLSAGFGQTFNWTLSYQTTQIAKKNGQIWEIFIPKPADVTEVDNYTIGLYVPSSFGKPYILKPAPKTSDHVWSKDELATNGIFVSYFLGEGDNPFQVYDFKLRYHLYNSRLYPVETEIALPPDTNSQQIFLQTLIPQPINVRIDQDGNWLAKFSLGPAASLDVLATGSAVVYFRPQFSSDIVPKAGAYLGWQRYWETTDPRIVSWAKTNQTPEAIYNFVVRMLKYDFNRAQDNLSRLGASAALNSPNSAICLEFTDLFIALARAAGIPAREVNGYAAAVNREQQPTVIAKDALHSWPEYFDRQGATWRMIDPTWGNTTGGIDYFGSLDANHIAFAIKGQSSTAPSPAGTYKGSGSQGSDVEVSYHNGPFDPNQPPKISLRSNLGATMTSGFPFAGKIYLDNNGPTLFGPSRLLIQTLRLDVLGSDQPTSAIAPFGHLELPFTILPLVWTQSDNDIITVQFAGFQKDYPVALSPIYTNKYIFVIGGLTALGILSLIAQIIRGLFFQKR